MCLYIEVVRADGTQHPQREHKETDQKNSMGGTSGSNSPNPQVPRIQGI